MHLLWLIVPAFGWETDTTNTGEVIRWKGGEITFELQTTGTHGLTKQEIEEAIHMATDVWNASELDGSVSLELSEQRNPIGTVYFTDSWEHREDTLAYTEYSNDANTGQMVSFYISINSGKNEDWRWSVTGEEGTYDLVSALIHEFGHALGLQHSSVTEAVMAYQNQKGLEQRSLHADDIAGYRFLYAQGGSSDEQAPTNDDAGSSEGGAGSPGGTNSAGGNSGGPSGNPNMGGGSSNSNGQNSSGRADLSQGSGCAQVNASVGWLSILLGMGLFRRRKTNIAKDTE